MLVLSRKAGEGVTLELTEDLPKGTKFNLANVRTSADGRCRLGIDAPESVLILRNELVGAPAAATSGSAPASAV